MRCRAMIVLAWVLLIAADDPDQGALVVSESAVAAHVQGQAARLRVDPGAPSMPVFNPDFAARAGFKPGWIGTIAQVGPVRIPGKSAVVTIAMGGAQFKRRATWFAAPFLTDADAEMGPGGVPDPVVRFDLHSARPGERSVSVPLADFGWSGMGLWAAIGEARIRVTFSLDRKSSLATAGAGAAIAAEHGGRFEGVAAMEPIALGVERPARRLALETPFTVGPFVLDGLLVRVADFGSTAGVPDANAPEPDPDEIVVTGRRKSKQKLTLEIGRDQLDRCSSLLFDKRRMILTFTCL